MKPEDFRSSAGTLSFLARSGRFIAEVLRHLLQALVILWCILAIYYSNLPSWLRLIFGIGFLAFGAWTLWFSRTRKARLAFIVTTLCLIGWWNTIQPSHDRKWRPEVAVMPTATIDGDRVRITGFRHFEYHGSADHFTERFEEREVLLSRLKSVDFFVSYWKEGPVGHTFVSFNFEDALPVCISIETRPEIGEGFDPLASMFKQFELIYVVGDERDLVRVRTNFRGEDVYLYRIQISPENARRLFLIYLARINELAEHPEFYHLLSNSCTINIVRYANAAGRQGRFDLRHLLNGLVDRYLYASGFIDTSLPFAELRRRSHINEAAREAGDAPDFSAQIRAALPGSSETRRLPSNP